MMKMKKLMAALLVCSVITGCSSQEAIPDTEEEKINIADEYEKLDQDNCFEVLEKDALINILEHGTAAVFLGFPECPWCQVYIPMLDEVLKETGLSCWYYNVYLDKYDNAEYYDQVASLLKENNDTGEDIIFYNNEGRGIIFMPLVLFIEEGRITAFDHETCMESADKISPEDYWTEDKVTALKDKLRDNCTRIKEKQEENNDKGCDSGCKVGD